jgi:acyl-CoA thioesterase
MTKEEILHNGHTVVYWKENAEEDYITTPISVLKYISVLEATQEKQGWVKTSERLPEERQEVMVLISNQHEFAFYRDNRFNKRDWFGSWSGVVYWMPLPQKPEV